MASRGTISGTRITASWSVNWQSIENNSTNVTVTFNISFNTVSAPTTATGTISAGGIKKSFSVPIQPGVTSANVGTITANINHNAAGVGGMRVAANYQIVSVSSGDLNQWVNFDNIPRQATLLNVPNFNDEENPTIVYTNPAGESVTALDAAISFTGENPDIEYREVSKTGTQYTFNLTEEERRVLRTQVDGGNSIQLFFYLRTKIGSNIYFSYLEATYTIINGMPAIEATIKDTNQTTIDLTGDNKVLVKYFSDAYAYMNMIGYKEAYFTSYYMENNGVKVENSYSHVFNNVENKTFNFYVADNRNNGVLTSIDAPFVEYVKLSCNYEVEKMAASGTIDVKCSGNWFSGSFGAKKNTLGVFYRYKKQGDAEFPLWRQMETTTYENTYNASVQLAGLDYKETYIFQCYAVDRLMTAFSNEEVIKSYPVFHWGKDDFVFEVPVKFNAGYEGIQVSEAKEGAWVPALNNDAAVVSYSARMGWYSRIGKTVTLGFNIKAEVKSGFDTSTIAILGVPFKPIVAGFGGGVAHNIAFTAGHIFEGYCVGTDQTITLRGQPSNNTAFTNLNITSTAYYPTGSSNQVVTLAGTVSYYTFDE